MAEIVSPDRKLEASRRSRQTKKFKLDTRVQDVLNETPHLDLPCELLPHPCEIDFLERLRKQRTGKVPFIPIHELQYDGKQYWKPTFDRLFPSIQFENLKGSTRRGEDGKLKHCSYKAELKHYVIHFRCILITETVDRIPPGIFVLHAEVVQEMKTVVAGTNKIHVEKVCSEDGVKVGASSASMPSSPSELPDNGVPLTLTSVTDPNCMWTPVPTCRSAPSVGVSAKKAQAERLSVIATDPLNRDGMGPHSQAHNSISEKTTDIVSPTRVLSEMPSFTPRARCYSETNGIDMLLAASLILDRPHAEGEGQSNSTSKRRANGPM